MQVTPQISYKNLDPTERVRLYVEKELRHLEALQSRLISCRIAIEGPAGRRRKGDLYRVRLHLGLPGHQEVAVGHHSDDKQAHEDVQVAIRDAFRAAEHQLKKQKWDARRAAAFGSTRMAGKVARFIAGEPAGFILGEDGRDYYFHAREATGTKFDDLVIGQPVSFRFEDGHKGPMARAVHKRETSD